MASPEPLTADQLTTLAQAWNASAIVAHLGFSIAYEEASRVVVTLSPVRPEHRGGLGTDAINGGVLAGMFDFAVGCTSALAPPLRRSATISLSITFERGVRGDSARCEAWVERAARTLVFVSSRILDGEGTVCARCNGIVSLGPELSLEDWTGALASGDRPA